MRTADAVSHHSASWRMSVTLLGFVVVYCAVFGTGISYMLKLMANGPERSATPPSDRRPTSGGPSRPLSAAPRPFDHPTASARGS